jgi:hydroxymethylpyrimidine pyrophosphatase-like HAD family hydrolase
MKHIENLALLDLDGTLIGDDYQTTDDAIGETIQSAQNAGWSIGLHSDTPYEALELWRERFGMNGPIIAEKGAVIELAGKVSLDDSTANAIDVARQNITRYAQDRGIAVWSGNPVEAIREGLQYGEPGQTVMLINALSRCSLRFFVRTCQPDGRLAIDDVRTQAVISDFRPLFPEFPDLTEDNNPTFGLMIAARGNITKRHGAQQLMARLGISRCVMIGNSMSDYLGNDIADHFAVGNASTEYQAVATTVPEELTHGCVAILRTLAERSEPVNSSNFCNNNIK